MINLISENRDRIKDISSLELAKDVESKCPMLFDNIMGFLVGPFQSVRLTDEVEKNILHRTQLTAICSVLFKRSNRDLAIFAARMTVFLHTNGKKRYIPTFLVTNIDLLAIQ